MKTITKNTIVYGPIGMGISHSVYEANKVVRFDGSSFGAVQSVVSLIENKVIIEQFDRLSINGLILVNHLVKLGVVIIGIATTTSAGLESTYRHPMGFDRIVITAEEAAKI